MSQSPTEAVSAQKAINYTSGFSQLTRLVENGMSHSGHERNVCFLNTGGGRFANISALSGIDLPDDARAIAPVDWDQDGDLDLWIANRTGPQLRLLQNRAGDGRDYVALKLVGKTVNRDAIGARVKIEFQPSDLQTESAPLVQTVRAGSGFLSQGSRWLHFGLHDAPEMRNVTVRWPGAREETFTGLQAGGRYQLVQGTGKAARLEDRPREVKLSPARLDPPELTEQARIWLTARPPMPQITYDNLFGRKTAIAPTETGPLLVNLWATWCAPCAKELKDIGEQATDLESAGVDVLALSVDALGKDGGDAAAIRKFTGNLNFPYEVGLARAELIAKLEIVYRKLFARQVELPVPTSFLIDKNGKLAAIYLGTVEMDVLLDDLSHLDDEPEERRAHGDPIAGTWFTKASGLTLDPFAQAYLQAGYADEAVTVLTEALRQNEQDATAKNLMGAALLAQGKHSEAELFFRRTLADNPGHIRAGYNLGLSLAEQGRFDEAIGLFRQVVKIDPDWADAQFSLAHALEAKQQWLDAEAGYRETLRIDPQHLAARNGLGVVLARRGQAAPAIAQLKRVLSVDPENSAAHHNLGLVLMQQQQMADAITHLQQALGGNAGDAEIHNSLGVALSSVGKPEEAIEHHRKALQARPKDANIHYNLAAALKQQGEMEQALSHYQQAYDLAPERPLMANALAWMLATMPDVDLRQRAKAVQLAKAACQATEFAVPAMLDTLAAAYAAVGDFENATSTAKRANTLARSLGEEELAREVQQRLQLYRDEKPFVQ